MTSNLSHITFGNIEDEISLRSGVLRINDICNSLLKKNESPTRDYSFIEIQSAIDEVINETRLIHNENDMLSVRFRNIETDHNLKFSIDLSGLKRTICNLITNSIEACDLKGEISISISSRENSLEIGIEDFGTGFPLNSENLFERGFTTKPNGNGFGLSSAKSFIESIGGCIIIKSLKDSTLVILTLPAKQLTPYITVKEIVLIDDDPLVRFNWTRQAQRKGILVHTFESFNSFIEVRRKFSLDVPIYIDSNLGKVKGELVSEELVSLGFVSVILTTGLPPHAISNTKWISGIVGKGFESAVLMNH